METFLSIFGPDGASAGAGVLMGQYFRSKAEQRKQDHELKIALLEASNKSHDAAGQRDGAGGTVMRRWIYGTIAFTFAFVLIAGAWGAPIILENEVTKGFLFWQKKVVEYVTVHGVFFAPEIRRAFSFFVGFYVGQGVK